MNDYSLRFSFFGFPVVVQPMFWLVMVFLGAQGDLSSPQGLTALGLWVLIGFGSILWHELGHCIFQKKYGSSPAIVLWAGGGLAIPRTGLPFTRTQSFVISLAGPFFGFLLGAAAWLLKENVEARGYLAISAIRDLLWINIVWSAVNLLPMLPLDGGHALKAILGGRQKLVAGISVAVAMAATAGFLYLGSIWGALWFGYFAFQNLQLFRGEVSRDALEPRV